MLHIATHGFFYAPKRQQKSITISNLVEDLFLHDYSSVIEELNEDKMLTRSGIILAGGNNKLRKVPIPKGVEDGILFADELATLNLSDLDLVVLSACESGLGNIISSEGVFGLQRGFKIAGAKSILMSLWKVDDQATQVLMTAFHRNLIAGQNKREAFQNAQFALRTYDNKYDAPNYWAAFVLLDALE
jgi:CHAT domain-containing protein